MQVSRFPASSVASHITDDKPAPKVLPEGGMQVVATAVSKLSVADGVPQFTVKFAVVMFAGHVISGSVLSGRNIKKYQYFWFSVLARRARLNRG